MTWHVLDVGSIWMKEFAGALSRLAPTIGWAPDMRWTALWENWEREETLAESRLRLRRFPLQRGYHRFPLSTLVNLGRRQTRRMQAAAVDAAHSPLICTTPYYAPVAETWPGPVIYYQTDLTIAYAGLDSGQIRALDRRLCRVARAVCPNSQRIGEYFVHEAGCDPAKIVVVPNATREENVLAAPPGGPGNLPADLADLPRPVLGVLGNLAANLDWCFLEEAVRQTPGFSWAFVGPTNMDVPEPDQRAARERLLAHGSRVRFVGSKSYGDLQKYARAVDAAVLPYRRKEPTYSGSSTRFYEHLAACRPMLSTRGFEELLHKEPLLRLVDTPGELAAKVTALRRLNFADGEEHGRWEASRQATWTVRAHRVVQSLRERWPAATALTDWPDDPTGGIGPEPFQVRIAAGFDLVPSDALQSVNS